MVDTLFQVLLALGIIAFFSSLYSFAMSFYFLQAIHIVQTLASVARSRGVKSLAPPSEHCQSLFRLCPAPLRASEWGFKDFDYFSFPVSSNTS